MTRISSSLTGDDIMKQSKMTADDHLWDALKGVDDALDARDVERDNNMVDAITKNYQVLIAAHMQAAAIDAASAILAQQIRSGFYDLIEAIREAKPE